ncbi:MAG: TIM-barrel domain-containing protein [Janthinobacterium lividum]
MTAIRTNSLFRFAALTLFLIASSPAISAPNPVVVGSARFTVITPNCIRIEYSLNAQFVDAPSLFAADRMSHYNSAKVTQSASSTVIDTGAMRLTYTPDGQPFSAANLHADIKRGTQTVAWTPGAPNPGNLGGTIRTLDGADGPVDLGQGLLSRDGWYLLDDSRNDLLTKDWVQARPAGAGTDWYLFGYGDDYRAALKSLAAVGGPVPLPRKYALGTWYSRYWPYSSADYRQIVGEYTTHDFPLDNIVMDMDWHKDGWTGWSWNRQLLPDAEQLLPWFHSQGLHVTLNLHPADGVGPQEDQYATFMHDMGADPATKQTLPFDAGSKKYMDTLFQDIFTPLEKDGVDFWWLDWQQYEFTRSIPDLTNLFWLNTLLYDRTAQNGQRGLSFSRWAGWGDHRHPIHFSGDASTSFQMLAFEVPFTSTAGNVGCFFWSHDIGGHNRGRNEESYARWVQFGATSPVLRSHSTRDVTMDRRPWTYPLWAENSMRVSFHLRDELFPYIYTSAAESSRETIPLDRPLYFDHPTEENAYHNAQEYLLGDNLLAAPIVTPGVGPGHVGTQTVWFPAGTWFNTFTGERFTGGTQALVSADINEFPLYARGGVPIPMQPYTPRMATSPLNTLRVRCFPGTDGQTGRFTLYEDDGLTTGYERGQSASTPLTYSRHGSSVTVTVGATHGHFTGQPTRRGLVIELPDTMRAASALSSGRPVPVTYNAETWTNRITIPARSVSQTTVVTLTAAPAGFRDLSDRAATRRVAGVTGKLKFALADPSLPPDQQEALLAVIGVGLVRHNEGTYLYNGTLRNYFYAPPGVIDGGTVTDETTGKQIAVQPQTALLVTGPTTSWRGRTIAYPSRVSFAIGGQVFHLPLVPTPGSTITTDDNITQTAKVTANGSQDGYSPEGAVDGILGGYPAENSQEWSAGKIVGATLTLTWDTPQKIDHIALYDRPNLIDQITAGEVSFSDGSTISVGQLPNDGKTPLDLHFPAKTITSLTFKVTAVTPAAQNAGLSEIAVYKAK